MEIISYVQREPKRKITYVARKNTVSYSFNYPSERHSFKAGTVKESVSAKSILVAIGQALTKFADYVKTNWKKILIYTAIAIGFAFAAAGTYIFVDYRIAHTGRIEMSLSEDAGMENLNRLMTVFALETDKSFDDDGKIFDADSTKQIYTAPVTFETYKVQSGDTISGITHKFGLSNISTLISINNITNVRQLAAGKKLKIPSVDGIVYTVKKGDSLDSIMTKYNVSIENILDVNELSSDVLKEGQELFLPGVGLDQKTLKEAMGELFKMPIKSRFVWSSPYGWRIDPIQNVRKFHTGTDMACAQGTPIYASMSGKVIKAAVSPIWGNYVVIDHSNGYQTLYAHMSKIVATKGQRVEQGTKIGLVGSTGYSTGPHLHFTVYKNGKMVDPMSVLTK